MNRFLAALFFAFFTVAQLSIVSAAQSPLRYQVYIEKSGWLSEVSDNVATGTTGQGRRLEAIRISLGNGGGIQYCAHVEKKGWLGWAKNGETAGSTGQGLRIEAIQIKLVAKNNANYNSRNDTRNNDRYDNRRNRNGSYEDRNRRERR